MWLRIILYVLTNFLIIDSCELTFTQDESDFHRNWISRKSKLQFDLERSRGKCEISQSANHEGSVVSRWKSANDPMSFSFNDEWQQFPFSFERWLNAFKCNKAHPTGSSFYVTFYAHVVSLFASALSPDQLEIAFTWSLNCSLFLFLFALDLHSLTVQLNANIFIVYHLSPSLGRHTSPKP